MQDKNNFVWSLVFNNSNSLFYNNKYVFYKIYNILNVKKWKFAIAENAKKIMLQNLCMMTIDHYETKYIVNHGIQK